MFLPVSHKKNTKEKKEEKDWLSGNIKVTCLIAAMLCVYPSDKGYMSHSCHVVCPSQW